MEQVLHANARTTEAIRREIRNSEESIAKAAVRYNVNPKTIIKWKKREDTQDLPMGPKKVKSTVLSAVKKRQLWLSDSLHNCLLMMFCIVFKKRFSFE